MLKQPRKTTETLREKSVTTFRDLHGKTLTAFDLDSINQQVHECTSLFLEKLTNKFSLHVVRVAGVEYTVIYDKRRKCVSEFVVRESLTTWLAKYPLKNQRVLETWREKYG